MANDIGDVKGIRGFSTSLNTQPGNGGDKPLPMGGKSDPGGTKPPESKEVKVPLA